MRRYSEGDDDDEDDDDGESAQEAARLAALEAQLYPERTAFCAADKARLQLNTKAKQAAPKFNYTRLQSLMFSLWRAWIHRYPTIVWGKLEAVVKENEGLPAVDRDAERWAGVFTVDPINPGAPVPNQRAWEIIKSGSPSFYHVYCIMSHVDRLFTG